MSDAPAPLSPHLGDDHVYGSVNGLFTIETSRRSDFRSDLEDALPPSPATCVLSEGLAEQLTARSMFLRGQAINLLG